MDYFINNRNTLSVSGTLGAGKFKPENLSELLVDSLYTVKTSSYTERLTNSTFDMRFKGAQLSFKHNFPKAGRDWTADVTYNKRKNAGSNFKLSEADFENYFRITSYFFLAYAITLCIHIIMSFQYLKTYNYLFQGEKN